MKEIIHFSTQNKKGISIKERYIGRNKEEGTTMARDYYRVVSKVCLRAYLLEGRPRRLLIGPRKNKTVSRLFEVFLG